jgi:hypothetical protein
MQINKTIKTEMQRKTPIKTLMIPMYYGKFSKM